MNRQPIKETTYKYTDVPEGEEYEFRVLAVNEAGCSKPTEPTPITKIKEPFGEWSSLVMASTSGNNNVRHGSMIPHNFDRLVNLVLILI